MKENPPEYNKRVLIKSAKLNYLKKKCGTLPGKTSEGEEINDINHPR